MSSSTPDWDTLRKGTRSLENEIEAALANYSRLAAAASTTYGASGTLPIDQKVAYNAAEQDIQQNLTKLGDLVEGMSSLLSTSSATSSTAMHHTARRHQEIVQDYNRDFKRIQSSLKEAEQRANLLGSVRDEISAFKAASTRAGGSEPNSQGLSDADRLLSERGHIDSSHRMADDVLGQAYATRSEFASQRNMLSGVNSRMTGIAAQIPGINSVLSMINSRRRRDSLILGSLISVCALILVWMVTR